MEPHELSFKLPMDFHQITPEEDVDIEAHLDSEEASVHQEEVI